MKQPRLFLVLLLVAFGSMAAAQPVRVLAKISQEKILIGEPFQLTLQVQIPANGYTEWFRTDTFPHFEILHRSAIDTQRLDDVLILVQNIKVTSWDSGRWRLPVFALPRSNRSQPPPVTVAFSPMDPAQDYHDIKDVLNVDAPRNPSWYWYLIGAALLLLFLYIIFPGRGKKEKEKTPSGATAYREAIRQLEALEKGAATADPKIFYTDLIQVFRSYLAQRKNFYSAFKTTGDIQKHLPDWGLEGERARMLQEALLLSDGVKFARFAASAEERRASLKAVRESVVQLEKQQPVAAKP